MATVADTSGSDHLGTVVYFANTSEDVWPFIQAMSDEKQRAIEIEENAILADRDLFSLVDYSSIVFVTPQKLSTDFLAYFAEVSGGITPQILVPKEHTGRVSRDLLNDRKTFAVLREIGRKSPLTLLSYSSSKWFLSVVDELREAGVTVHLPQAPEEDAIWTVNLFGSKTGIRQLIQQLHVDEPLARMSEGFIMNGLTFGSKVAAALYLRGAGAVLKTQKGHAGSGVMILRKGELPTEFRALADAIKEKLSVDEYWRKFPMVVEEYIDTDESISGGFPSAEFRVDASGKTEFLYTCGMRVTAAGVFQGVEIHKDVVPADLQKTLETVGKAVGREYAQYGYRGYFDIDFALAKDGTVYVTESNVRRTGGTHVYHMAKKLFGADFLQKTFVLSNNTFRLPSKTRIDSFSDLHKRLKPLLFDPKTREGLILCGENLLVQEKMAYIIFGNDRERAVEIERKMIELLA